jgi:hypothetical protein
MPSNISLSYPNRIDECLISDAYQANNWSTQLPLINVQNKVLKKVARTNLGITGVVLKINLPSEPRFIGCVALANHNLSVNATLRVMGYYGLDFSGELQFDSTPYFRAFPIIHPNDSGHYAWESKDFWLGTISEQERKSYTALATFYAPENKLCRSVQIAISDSSNPDGYLQIGRIFLGQCIEPHYNPEFGDISQGYVDLTEVQRAGDNTKYFYIKPKMRTLSCVLKHLNQAEAFSGFYDAQREVGLSGEMLYAFSKPEYIKDGTTNINMTVDKNFYARAFLCNFSELSPIDMAYANGFRTALKLEEII